MKGFTACAFGGSEVLAMHISSLYIRNFRNFAEVEMLFSKRVTTIVGPNSAGKTSIVAALRLLLDPFMSRRERLLEEDDFHDRESIAIGKEILISATLTDFESDENDRAYTAKWTTAPDRAQLTYRFKPNERARLAYAFRVEERKEAEQKAVADPLIPIPDEYIFTLDQYEYDRIGGLNDAAGGIADLKTLTIFEAFGEQAEGDLRQFAYIEMPAMRDVVRDMASRRTSPLHRLLDITDIPNDVKARVEKAVREANEAIRADEFFAKLEKVIDESYESLAATPDKLSVHVGIADPKFAAAIRSLSLLMSDDYLDEAEMSRNGLGYNNLLYVAILMRFFEQRSLDRGNSQLLVIEEPEAHLHPNSQIALLRELMNRPYQTILTSHSGYCVSPVGLENVVVVSKDKKGSVTTNLMQAIGASAQERADLERYLDANRGALLFAQKVVLVEGISEEILLQSLADAAGLKLSQKNVAIISVVGTHYAILSRLVAVSGMKATCHLVVDGDKQNDKAWLKARLPDSGKRIGAASEGTATVHRCETTLEMAITQPENREWIVSGLRALGAPQVAARVDAGLSDGVPERIQLAQLAVVRTADRLGKGRFAQVLAGRIASLKVVPEYLQSVLDELAK